MTSMTYMTSMTAVSLQNGKISTPEHTASQPEGN